VRVGRRKARPSYSKKSPEEGAGLEKLKPRVWEKNCVQHYTKERGILEQNKKKKRRGEKSKSGQVPLMIHKTAHQKGKEDITERRKVYVRWKLHAAPAHR